MFHLIVFFFLQRYERRRHSRRKEDEDDAEHPVLPRKTETAIAAKKSETKGKINQDTIVNLQLLSTMDWHANLEPLDGVGGAAYYSEYWRLDEEKFPFSLRLTAGDAFGATPALVSLNDEEPAVIAERMLRISFDTFGNHNFVRGKCKV